MPSYQIASVCDDTHFNISHIVRGEDLLPSTAAQLYIAKLTQQHNFLHTIFYHHALIKNEAGQKLSKSAGDMSIKNFMETGATPQQLMHEFTHEFTALPHQLGFAFRL